MLSYHIAGLPEGLSNGNTATFTAPAGWQIAGFHGRSGELGVIYTRIP